MKALRILFWGGICGVSSIFESTVMVSIIGGVLWMNITKAIVGREWMLGHNIWWIIWTLCMLSFVLVQKILLAKYEVNSGLMHTNEECGCLKAAIGK